LPEKEARNSNFLLHPSLKKTPNLNSQFTNLTVPTKIQNLKPNQSPIFQNKTNPQSPYIYSGKRKKKHKLKTKQKKKLFFNPKYYLDKTPKKNADNQSIIIKNHNLITKKNTP